MDWSKAKNVLIAALLLANIILGQFYFGNLKQAKLENETAAVSTETYAKSLGIDLQAEIPKETPKLPVLFVKIAQGDAVNEFEGYVIETEGVNGVCANALRSGSAKEEVITASAAMHKLISEISDCDGLVISDIKLVYWVDRSAYGSAEGEDTALPAWKFVCTDGAYYINAFGE